MTRQWTQHRRTVDDGGPISHRVVLPLDGFQVRVLSSSDSAHANEPRRTTVLVLACGRMVHGYTVGDGRDGRWRTRTRTKTRGASCSSRLRRRTGHNGDESLTTLGDEMRRARALCSSHQHSSRLGQDVGGWDENSLGQVERGTGRAWDELGKTRMGRVERDEGATLVSATDVGLVELETSTMLVSTSNTVGLARDESDRRVDTAVPIHPAGLARTRGPRRSCGPMPGTGAVSTGPGTM